MKIVGLQDEIQNIMKTRKWQLCERPILTLLFSGGSEVAENERKLNEHES